VRQDDSGRRKRDESWSSRRHDSDDGDSSACLPEGRRDEPSVLHPAAVNNAAGGNKYDAAKMWGGVKLDVYDGSTCLETFLASVKNFTTYYRWTVRDELFHLKASLKGPAGQLLWDLGSDVSLDKLLELLRHRFRGADQEERFWMELRNRRRRPKEDLPSLYSDICRLMSLAYPGPDPSNVKETVGLDATHLWMRWVIQS